MESPRKFPAGPAILVVLALIGGVVFFATRSEAPDQAPSADPGSPAKSEPRAAPAVPAGSGTPTAGHETGEDTPPDPGPQLPAERPAVDSTTDTSRQRIGAVRTNAEAAEVHRALTHQLMTRLEGLTTSKRPNEIRVAMQELADRLYLLDRVVTVYKLEKPGPASVTEADRARIEALLKIWTENMELSLTVDELFRQRGLLPDEHVPQTLRKWLNQAKAAAEGQE